jgi:hypothetical protein
MGKKGGLWKKSEAIRHAQYDRLEKAYRRAGPGWKSRKLNKRAAAIHKLIAKYGVSRLHVRRYKKKKDVKA